MKLRSDHAGKSQENQNNNNNNNRIKFIGKKKKKAPDKNENYHHCPQAVRGRRSLPRSSLFPFAAVSRGCVPGCARRGSGGGGGGSGSLRRGPRCGPAHVTAAGVAPDPARIGLLPAGGVGIRPAGSAPGGGDAPFGSPLERGRGRREDGGRMRPTRTTRVTPSLLTPSHLQPQGWRCPPAPGLGVAPRFIFPGFLRCPSGRRCSPPLPPLPPSLRILVSRRNQRGTHRDLSDWAVGLQRTWRSAFLLRARAAALLCNKTQNTGDGDGSLTSRAPTSPCPSPAARGPAVAGAMLAAVPGSQGGSGPSPPRRGPAVPIPSALPHSWGSAVPRGNAASSPQLTAQQGPAAGRETTDAFSPIFPVGSSPERGGRRGRSTYTPASS